ncbi:MAG: glycosyltransferase [Nevskia sp.]|nr:glycosyltransferase [Nevskia sp.]
MTSESPHRLSSDPAPQVSLVIPMYNERDGLDHLFSTLLPIIGAATESFEIVVVNDGSSDDTLQRLLDWQSRLAQLRVIDLSRNFGKEAALTAGLQHCRGACAITLDADLQDPPELIVEMLARWREGYETVVAVHAERSTDPYMQRQLSSGFYRLLNAVSEMRFVPHAGDFRLLDRCVIDAFLQLPERTRFNKGLFAWIGFRPYLIKHHRPARTRGKSAFNFRRLLHLATDGITSFSLFPLRLWMYVGTVIAGLAFVYGSFIVLRTIVLGSDVPGYASIIVAVMFLGGINLFSIGVLGAYVGRIFLESKQRPLYVVRRAHEPSATAAANESR